MYDYRKRQNKIIDKIIIKLIRKIEKLKYKYYSPITQLQFMGMGHMYSQLIKISIELDLPDILNNNELSIEELALKTNTKKLLLYRVLRVLNAMQIININKKTKKYSLGKFGIYLIKNNVFSIRNMLMIQATDWYWGYKGIINTLKNGKLNIPDNFSSFWEYLEKNQIQSQYFNNSMEESSKLIMPEIISKYNFTKYKHIFDIGGGNGNFLFSILNKYNNIKGTLFETKNNIIEAEKSNKFSDRCNFICGSFFNKIPPGGDCYIMKHILHDWDDKKAKIILKNCNNAMNPKDSLLLCEIIINDIEYNWYSLYLDMLLLSIFGGKERTKKEFGKLLKESGFKIIRIIKTKSFISIIEAIKITNV